MMVLFMDTWSILRSFVTFYGHLVQLVVIGYTFSRFGILYQEKSGNPAHHPPLYFYIIIFIFGLRVYYRLRTCAACKNLQQLAICKLRSTTEQMCLVGFTHNLKI
jgi:hypothetical protein